MSDDDDQPARDDLSGTTETPEGPPQYEGGDPGGEAAPGAGAETTGGGQRSGNPDNED